MLAWVGDHFQIPTVGVVVDPAHIPPDSPAAQGLVRANQRALELLVENPSRAVDYIAGFLDRLTRDEAQQYYQRYIEPYFAPDAWWTSTSRSTQSTPSPPNSAWRR